ncbi:hypothetical protein HYN59_00800 [Flavobacterium album]|uniref:DUF4293 domain-containing protein n=1 Tax=Flavobacterium album TaxID=2175091 RepID=A0A2S1QU05_9FLAO|nr:hypothetical protein [Flavobacterium album]AWH83741.1 hypothetical protein HYN59_00800 [Flavobacterium album]
MRKRSKTYLYFFVAALLLQLIAVLKLVFVPETIDTSFDMNIYDTYYVIDEFTLIESVTGIYFLLGLGYWILYRLKRRPSIMLSNIHALVTVGGLAFYLIASTVASFIEDNSYGSYYRNNDTLLILLLPLVALAQLLYVINIVIGIQTPYHRHRRRKTEY